MSTASHDDNRRRLRDGRETAAGHGPVPAGYQPVLFTIVGRARPGWLVRAYADPGRLCQIDVEWTEPWRGPRPPVPAWVTAWVQRFARR